MHRITRRCGIQTCAFGLTSELAPQIELPAEFEGCIVGWTVVAQAVQRKWRRHVLRSLLRLCAQRQAYGRKEVATRHACGRAGLIETRNRTFELLIVRRGGGHEAVEPRIVEDLPPFTFRQMRRRRCGAPGHAFELRRCRGGRTFVIGTDLRKRKGRETEEKQSAHGRINEVWTEQQRAVLEQVPASFSARASSSAHKTRG